MKTNEFPCVVVFYRFFSKVRKTGEYPIAVDFVTKRKFLTCKHIALEKTVEVTIAV